MNDKKIENIKKIYLSTGVPEETVNHLWTELVERLPEKQYHPYHYMVQYAFLTLCICIFVFGGTIGIAQAAKPNTPLYPIKLLSGRVAAKIIDSKINIEKVVNNAANTIQNKSSDKKVPEPTNSIYKSFKKTESENESQNKNSGKSFYKLKDTPTSIPTININSKRIPHESINNTADAKKEVNGASTENHPTEKPNAENNRQSFPHENQEESHTQAEKRSNSQKNQ